MSSSAGAQATPSQAPRSQAGVHAVCRICAGTPAQAYAVLATARGLSRWNLGLWNTREVEPGLKPGLFTGESLFGGGRGWVRVEIHESSGTVDYAVGGDPAHLVTRIQARVQTAEPFGYPAGHCLVTLLAWRTADMDDERWQRLVAAHEVEIDLIRGLITQLAEASQDFLPVIDSDPKAADRG